MRRMLNASTPLKVMVFSRAAAVPPSPLGAPKRSHAHSHDHNHGGGAHHHSHAAIEKEIEGKNLHQCQVVTLAGGATNVFFSVTKIWFGSSGGSVALVADGFHALTDIVADVVSYASISLAKKQLPRCRFPFGIGRLETSGAVFVAFILLAGGLLLLLHSFQSCVADLGHQSTASATASATAVGLAVSSALGSTASDDHGHEHGHEHGHGGGAAHGHSHFDVTAYDAITGRQVVVWTMVALAASSIVCKELLFHWTRRVGKRAGSRVVVANAYHHRADAWSGAVALVGVAGQMIGIPGVDGIAGLVVSLSICKIGYSLFRDSVMEFFDYQNADEVGRVRERLRDFHLRVRQDGAITAERNEPSNSGDLACDGGGATGLQASKIGYINVFLMRHGHSYALHVQLLVHESQTATQIKEATDQLEKLAKESLPIQESFISLLVCSPATLPRAEYYAQLHRDAFGASPPAESEESKETDSNEHIHHDHDHDHDHGHSHQKPAHSPASPSNDPEMFIAAEGELVNPSLEKCIKSLCGFHGFTQPIRYNWETRTVTMPKEQSCECSRDVESVAKIFMCKLVGAHEDGHHHHHHEHSHGEVKKSQ